MAKNPYEHRWIKGDRIGKGGQGLTYLAVRNPDDGKRYALKLLKEQRNQERRERMFVEVSALQVLQHTNIPQYFDSNGIDYQNNVVDLYLITEFIPGDTLEDFVSNNGLFNLQDSIKLTLQLTDTIAYCHLKGFYHRDIKPDNIILRDSKIESPYLIDFGLSFNEEIVKGETPSWQHIGNRFLSLPELRVREGNKRDRRSDITMLCGILLFCLTGVHPTDLLDETQTKPHRRQNSKEILQKLDKRTFNALNRFFDIGFNLGINDRWQSAESIRNALNDLQQIKPSNEMDESDALKKLDAYKENIAQRVDFKQLDDLKALFNKCNEIIGQACQSVINQLKPANFGNIQGGFSMDLSKQLFTNKLGITHPYHEKLNFFPKFTCYVNGSELVIEASDEGRAEEFLRHPLNEEIDWNALEENLRTYYVNGLTSKDE